MKITKQFRIVKIISGGQTGVDRASLDVAIAMGMEHGGFCPKGRLAEDGFVPLKYKMNELEIDDYSARTLKNVQFSDGTLILHTGQIAAGTALTEEFCSFEKKPLLKINTLDDFKVIRVNFNTWLEKNSISTLNIAGPRESEAHICQRVKVILMELLTEHI